MNNSVSVPSRTAGGDPAAFSKPPVRARIEKAIRNLLNVLVLLGSVLVIAALSFEVFHNLRIDTVVKFNVLVSLHARSGRNQFTDDYVFLQADEPVILALDCSIRENFGCFLEGCR